MSNSSKSPALFAAFLTASVALSLPATAATKKKAAAAPDAGATAEKAESAAPAAPSGPPPANSSPMAELKKSNAQLDKILQKKTGTAEQEAQRADVRKVVGSFLDYGELARRSLARHWDTLTPKQREEFTNTLRDLVERSYLKQIHGGSGGSDKPGYTIKYEKETKGVPTPGESTVNATLLTTARGKKVTVALEYKMLWKDHWVVYDVLTDDQSMLENYRAEFNKIINKEGFDALLKRMKKKLDEQEKDKN